MGVHVAARSERASRMYQIADQGGRPTSPTWTRRSERPCFWP
ncbi:hypothetical protein ACHAWF_003013 [Thalassiosira exigua]